MSGYLDQAEDSGEVGPYEVWNPLLFVCLECQRHCLPIPPHLYRNLPNLDRDERYMDLLEVGVLTVEV